jgi:peptidoglycan hydrolase-like protein with peptidoglycan-binding domain
VPVSVAPSEKPHVEPKPALKRGMGGEDVKKLQEKLFVTGTFDTRTEEAIRALQKNHGLVPDGIVGPYTWDIL